MNEERMMILQMLRDGTVSIEEAERLIEALPAQQTAVTTGGGMRPIPRQLKVLVTENQRTKVNVKVPFSLIRTGLKLGTSFGILGARYSKSTPEDVQEIVELLKEIDIDELLAAITDGAIQLPYTIADIDEENHQVSIILE